MIIYEKFFFKIENFLNKFLKNSQDIINPKQEATHDLFLDLLKKLLDYDPDKRITANEALKHPFFALEIDPPVKN